MKRMVIMAAVVTLLPLFIAAECFTQEAVKWKGSGGWGTDTPYNRKYDSRTVETLIGQIVSVDLMAPMKGMSAGVHLTLRTPYETISVHLGPAWYIESQDIRIDPGAKVEITGSRVTIEGKPSIIATEVKRGAEVLRLRNGNGLPVWSGWRR